MIEYVFELDDLARVRFAISPSLELAESLHALRDPSRGALHAEWMQSVRGSLAGLDLGPALALLSHPDYTPDFLTPPPESPLTSLEEDLERMAATPAAQIRREVGVVAERVRSPELDRFAERPREAVRRLVAALREYWERALAPSWPRVKALLDADVVARARHLAEAGAGAVLADLHPAVRWNGDRLAVRVTIDRVCELGGRGLLLVPSAFRWAGPLAVIGQPWQPSVVYPARGIGLLWAEEPALPEAAAALLGRRRARLLAELGAPASTTQLAARLGFTPSGTSQHLSVLAAAALVSRRREGREVLYLRTPLGDALLGR